MFDHLPEPQADPILALMSEFRADPRSEKTDLGVGVYRDQSGNTPVMQAVKQAEKLLLDAQESKSYLGPVGNLEFLTAMQKLVLGETLAPNTVSFQSPGGTGALRLAFSMLKASRADTRVWVMAPTWGNHMQLIADAGLDMVAIPYLDEDGSDIAFEAIEKALSKARSGDVVLVHGCCHNPTGLDLRPEHWDALQTLMTREGLIPLIDLAYQGFGDGLEQDVVNLRRLTRNFDEFIVAASCSKNFGLYRERVGAVFAGCKSREACVKVSAAFASISRGMYSMPPDHGASVVSLILTIDALRQTWSAELETMRQRVAHLRASLASELPELPMIGAGKGMFTVLPLRPAEVIALKEEHGFFLAPDGRVNLAGLQEADVALFAKAVSVVRQSVISG